MSNPKRIVFFHKNCPSGDGFGSAFAAWLKFGVDCTYAPVERDDTLPDVTGADVYILDIAFGIEVMDRLSSQAASLTLLDHHATAQKQLSTFKPVCCGKIHFDLGKAASMLAWEHFHPDTPAPRLFNFIQDRDLWLWRDPDSKPFLTWLDIQPRTFESWKRIIEMTDVEVAAAIAAAPMLEQQANVICEAIARNATPVVIAGEKGLMVNDSGHFRSQVGSALAEVCGTFSLIWRVSADGKVLCSLRAVRGYDVERLAVLFGGGGHKTAAAFTLPLSAVLDVAQGRLDPPPSPAAD